MIQGTGKVKFENAITEIYTQNRFTSYFFMNVEIVPNNKKHFTAGIGTRNNKVYLYYSEDFISGLTHNQILGLLVHEMGHVVRGHFKRTTKEFNPGLSNRAMDCLINEDIIVHGDNYLPGLKLDLPPGGSFLPKKYKPKWEDLRWEELYYLLKKDAPPPSSKQNQFLATKDVCKIVLKGEKDGYLPYKFQYQKENWEIIYDSSSKEFTLVEMNSKKKPQELTNKVFDITKFESAYPEKLWELLPLFSSREICQGIVNGVVPTNIFIYKAKEAYTFDFDSAKNKNVQSEHQLEFELTDYPKDENKNTMTKGAIEQKWDKRDWLPINDNPCGGRGDGEGDGGRGKGNSQGFDDHSGFGEADEAEIDRIIDRAAEEAKGIGDGSANMLKTLENIRKRDTSFADKIKSTIDWLSCQDRQPSWRRLHRQRLTYDIIEKGWAFSHKKKLTVGVDTSGSMMDGKTLEACFGVVEGLSNKYTLQVVLIDTEIKAVQKYEPGDWRKFPVTGGGGTAFENFFNVYLKEGNHQEAVVMLTDGCVHTSGLEKYDNTCWVVTQENWEKPFGKYVYVNPDSVK